MRTLASIYFQIPRAAPGLACPYLRAVEIRKCVAFLLQANLSGFFGAQDTGFSPCCYWRFDVKPHFWPIRFAPGFARFLSQDTMGVYPVTLSLLARLSLLGVDLGWGASCDDLDRGNAKATKTRDTWGKKERLARLN